MSEPGTRPGGLTALAVINFVFAGFAILGGGSRAALPVLVPIVEAHEEMAASRRAASESREESRPVRRGVQPGSDEEILRNTARDRPALFVLAGGIDILLGGIMIAAGVGYLKLKRVLGRGFGTAYALMAIGWEAIEISFLNELLHKGFSPLDLIKFIYPAVTLLCLLFVFKDDFVN
jgi:hypothetical protein